MTALLIAEYGWPHAATAIAFFAMCAVAVFGFFWSLK